MKFTVKTIEIPLCEICETELPDCDPCCEFEDGFYCGECALRLGKITKEEYKNKFLYYLPSNAIKDIVIEEDKIIAVGDF